MSNENRIATEFYEAAFSPAEWSNALGSLAHWLDAVGAAYIIFNKESKEVDWACFHGPSAELKPEYVSHYASLDPYSPILKDLSTGTWTWLSESLPGTLLRQSDWYNDFVRRCGVENILGTRLSDRPSHYAVLGLHQEFGKPTHDERRKSRLLAVTDVLVRAAHLHAEFRKQGLRSLVTSQALDALSAGVIIVEADGRVVDANGVAEHILRRDDGLRVRQGRVTTLALVEAAKLEGLIALAAREAASEVGRITVTRRNRLPACVVTVASLPVQVGFFERPMAMLLVRDAEAPVGQARPPALQVVEEPSPAYAKTGFKLGSDGTVGLRYFFHVANGDFYRDDEGSLFSCTEEAVAHASRVARELAEDGSWDGYEVAIADANGNEIARVPVVRFG